MSAAPLGEALAEALFGGKAAQLALAARACLPVPAGVALSVPLVTAIAGGDQAATTVLDRALDDLRMPLAARSSAVGEDSEQASFAGQHITRLNLRSASQVREAVAAIWESARSPAVLAYRQRIGLGGEPRTAAIVQELVDADCAGVLFSRNPLDGSDEFVVEASWGLGEAVVAGLVVPDRVRLGRDGTVLEQTAGLKDIVVRPAPEGGTQEAQVPPSRARDPCLSGAQLRELVALARRCQQVFSGAQDLEWAFAGGRLFLLQRRAVTRVGLCGPTPA
jgi:pyruvate,water dikinase